jgi:hypothetical protein|tara:strand:- start:75417 stop:75653 length:237 start_codon:yes stop_codon:yes gene_type:complete
MVAVAQLAELRIVIPAVVGSSPISHPNSKTLDATRQGFFYARAVCGVVIVAETPFVEVIAPEEGLPELGCMQPRTPPL